MSGKLQLKRMQKLWEYADSWEKFPDQRKKLDEEIWKEFGTEKTIMFTDLSRFSKITKEHGILHFLSVIRKSHLLHLPVLDRFQGFLIKTIADDLVVAFDRSEDAVSAAVEMQKVSSEYNKTCPEESRIGLKVGIETGRILLLPDTDFFGDAVNIASKLGEDLAESGEILVGPVLAEKHNYSGEHVISREEEISGCVLKIHSLQWEKL